MKKPTFSTTLLNAAAAFGFFAVVAFLAVVTDGLLELGKLFGYAPEGSLAAVESLIGLRVLRPILAGTAVALGLAFLFDHQWTKSLLEWVLNQALGAIACVWGGVVGFALAVVARGLGAEPLVQVLLTSILGVTIVGLCRIAWTKGTMGPDLGWVVTRTPPAVRALIALPFLMFAPILITTVPLASAVAVAEWFHLT